MRLAHPPASAWRDRTLHTLLRAALPLGLVVFIPSLLTALQEGQPWIALVDTAAMATVVLLNMLPPSSYALRAYVFCLVVYALGAALLATVGPVAPVYLLGSTLIATLLLGPGVGLGAVALTTATMLAIGWHGAAAPTMLVLGSGRSELVWAVLCANFALVSLLLVIVLGNIIETLEKSVGRARAATEELRASEARFRELASNIGEVFFTVDLDTDRILYASEKSRQVWGVTPEELYAGTARVFDRIHPDDRDAVAAWAAARARDEPPGFLDYRIVDPDGTVRWVRSEGYPVHEGPGRLRRLVGIAHDVTRERELAAERETLDEQLRQAQKMDAVGRLAGGIAHDFNNMLSVIIGSSELAREAAADRPDLVADLDEILRAARRSGDLTRQLLAFARRQPIAPEVIDLGASLRGMRGMLARLVGEGIELRWSLPDTELPVLIDPAQFDQVVVNLTINARDAIGELGTIAIEASTRHLGVGDTRAFPDVAAGQFAVLRVRDDGSGMNEATLARVFEPFFTTKAAGAGTGLGLATVYGIVRQNGGMVDVESRPGLGTTFEVCLPLSKTPVPDRSAPPAEAARGRETILLVEDEEALLSLGERVLRQLGYDVLTARLPSEAFERSEGFAGEIHLLVTDVIMPQMNGRQVYEKLREKRPGLRCLFVSGYTADVLSPGGAVDDHTHFLEKPYTVAEMAAKVREALGGA